ncbi:unnamed protein product [Ceratitis capitata]|uniref:(Mediterranean fruit fly) hypothetical protein n=1 Tax=Ceratitis capitata TaxID=7213 RepID=A0A811VGP9_CERCA|nr:unnamed protein product [Ceratitis capitata]
MATTIVKDFLVENPFAKNFPHLRDLVLKAVHSSWPTPIVVFFLVVFNKIKNLWKDKMANIIQPLFSMGWCYTVCCTLIRVQHNCFIGYVRPFFANTNAFNILRLLHKTHLNMRKREAILLRLMKQTPLDLCQA